MVKKPPKSSTEEFEEALRRSAKKRYVLRLYVAGMTPISSNAIRNVKRLCVEHLAGRFDLEVVDIYQQPKLASGDQILAVPTLIKKLPPPLRKVIGDMSDETKFLVGIDLKPQE